MSSFRLSSSALKENVKIDAKYTCDGPNISPPLKWEGGPKETVSYALIVDDPDAPRGDWVHWVVYNIPATVNEIREGQAPSGATQGTNDFREKSYGGPCPPSGTHRYFFKIYALDTKLNLPNGATKSQLEQAMQSHILAQAQLVCPYSRR